MSIWGIWVFEVLLLNLARAGSVLIPILLAGLLFIIAMKKNYFSSLNQPIDFGTGIFGENKTWRGVLFYVVGGTLFTYPMHFWAISSDYIAPVFKADPLLVGLGMGGGYVVGELINSFIKRRLGIKSGSRAKSMLPRFIQSFFDNADGALVAGLVLTFCFQGEQSYLLIALVISLAIHALTDLWMRKLKLKKK